jgi:hypothetical protein
VGLCRMMPPGNARPPRLLTRRVTSRQIVRGSLAPQAGPLNRAT